MAQNSLNSLAETKFGKRLAVIGWMIAIPAVIIFILCNSGDDSDKNAYRQPAPVYIQNNQVVKAFPACISQSKLDEMTELSVRKDYAGVNYLLMNGYCVEVPKGAQVSILERGKFRLYKKNGGAVDLYTASEFLR